ncbi:MAG: filamentous hemagglutinin N-terminal domain-containing protein, partial [Verrucomicrobiae bacterium]|nr:filamentous hemagglutinin N-terminal domain-containing protein [Verrucomicrobiae bacterium]
MLGLPPVSFGNPQGPSVRQGQVRIRGSEGRLVIRQQSQRAVIDWDSFSIGVDELTKFRQPGAAAAVLNRVRGDSASRIEGMLRANGQVYLLNPNGILIGPNGSVDVAGFVASTLETDDSRFMRGGNQRFAGTSDAAIINLGSISALDGDVVLMAGSVLNEGTIRAPRGTAALAAGNDILLSESGSERVFVRGSGGSPKTAGVTNTGEIEANIAELKAHGGNVYGMAVKNEGRVAATGVTRNGGQIFLSAGGGKVRSTGTLTARKENGSGGRIAVDSGKDGGRTEIGGTVDASGPKGAGGEIVILGREIEVFDGTLILNDGATMGGKTYIGGGDQGGNPALANAEHVVIGRDTLLSARALESGQGGRVIVYASDRLDFGGKLSVAGSAGGHGGFAELSGARELFVGNLGEQVDLGAAHGPAGTLLLDPIDVSVISGINNGVVAGTSITDGSIVNFLSSTGNLIINTSGTGGSGDITLAGNTNISWSSANSLSFIADRDFLLSANALIESSGSGSFSVSAARAIQLLPNSAVRVKDGSLTLAANDQSTPTSGTFAGVKVDGASVESTGAGIVSVSGRGGDTDDDNIGVLVTGGGRIVGGDSATHFVSGTGGAAPGIGNDGIRVIGSGSEISSNGGNLVLQGTGGGSGTTSGMNSGVFVNNGGLITTGSGGNLDITGAGGSGGGDNHKGVWVSQAVLVPGTITSGGGAVTISGTGGGTGPGTNNQGVMVAGSNALISTGGVSLTITAAGGANSLTDALSNSGTISTQGNEPITLVTDGFDNQSGNVSSGTGTTLIRPRTADFSVSLGGADVAGVALGLTDTELDRVSAGLLEIGNASTGMIVVNAPITHGNDLSLVSGMNVTIGQSVTMDANKSFSVNTVDEADGSILLSSANAQLSATGSGTVTLVAARNLTLTNGSGISTTNGNLVISANAAGTATGGFSGIWLDGATVTTGDGSIFLTGKGGNDVATSGNHGVRVLGGTQVSSTGSGSVMINGQGGLGTIGNTGISIVGAGTSVRTSSGLLQVVGTGAPGAVDNDNDGISVNAGALVESTGGNVLVQGTAGGGTSGRNGIAVLGAGTTVRSEYGTVTLEGTGGSSNLVSNIGVGLYG